MADDNGAHSLVNFESCFVHRAMEEGGGCLIETHQACDGRSHSAEETVTKPLIAFTAVAIMILDIAQHCSTLQYRTQFNVIHKFPLHCAVICLQSNASALLVFN